MFGIPDSVMKMIAIQTGLKIDEIRGPENLKKAGDLIAYGASLHGAKVMMFRGAHEGEEMYMLAVQVPQGAMPAVIPETVVTSEAQSGTGNL